MYSEAAPFPLLRPPVLVMPRRLRFTLLAVLGAASLWGLGRAAGCGAEGTAPPDDDTPALARPAAWQVERQLDYLAWACTRPIRPGDTMRLMNEIACAEKLGRPQPAAGFVPDDAWDAVFAKMHALQDTSDFDALRFVNLLYAHRGHPAVSEALWTKLEENLLDFKTWYTDPTPERTRDGRPVVDEMWYWSENHILIFHTIEFLLGQRFPERVFGVSGLTGAALRERSAAWIREWLDERARWGFTEWHSNVYYNWDMIPLVSLVEWSADAEIALRAAMVLDLLWFDVALHLHRGTFGATHGRSYAKDFPAAELEGTFTATKLFFDDTALAYQSASAGAATLFARTTRYAMPAVLRDIARDDAPMVDRERMNLPLDERPPAKWDDPLPPAPAGRSFTNEADLPLWWSMSGMVTWPLLPMTLDVAERYDLWEGQFKSLAAVRELVSLGEPGADPRRTIFAFYRVAWPVLSQPLLTEVNTYTYRDAYGMLSTAQSYRPGQSANQAHAWQATLSEHAVVFTTHPKRLAVPEGESVPDPYDWHDEEPGPAYWTGDASRPRAGQVENVGIYIYAPQYKKKLFGLDMADYRDETHAYFPHAHFDEVAQEGGWTFGRKDGGFVALYSLRPTIWREGQPELYKNAGLPFDLVATGGADNVWILELGNVERYADFAAFRAAMLAARVETTPVPDAADDGKDDGYDVVYESPSRGRMTFGWHAPLTVAGTEHALRDYPRYDNPYAHAPFDATHYAVTRGGARLTLDFAAPTREFVDETPPAAR